MSKIINGDSLDVLKGFEQDTIDAIVCDPPFGYSFMGKDWDKAVPSVEIWQECLRVLKPGAFACVMSAPRSDVQNAMISRLMEAGFRLDFTPIYWTYASGFPKAGNVAKLVEKRLGNKHESTYIPNDLNQVYGNKLGGGVTDTSFKPQTPQAKALDGSYAGFQPKPAVEVVIIAMKPLSEKTYVDQALKNRKGITWLDDCRVPTGETTKSEGHFRKGNVVGDERTSVAAGQFGDGAWVAGVDLSKGRFPANLLVENSVLSYNRCTCIREDNTQTQQSDLKKDEVGIRATTHPESLTLLNDEQKLQQHSKASLSHQNIEQRSQPQESPYMTNEGVNLFEAPTATEPIESGCKPLKQEMDSSVLSVEQQKTYTTTTSNLGQHTPTLDSTLKTVASCALHATGKLRLGELKQSDSNYSRFFDLDAWARERLPAEQAMTFPFAIFPKASKSEKNKGLEHFEERQKVFNGQSLQQSANMKGVEKKFTTQPAKNFHPTVKPLKLMSYLITLFSREGDTVLDPFVGSGTTVVAAKQLGRKGIGIEREAEYAEIARARVEHAKTEDSKENDTKCY